MLAGELDGDAAASTADDARTLLTMGELAIHVGDDRRTKALAGIAERAVETRGPAVRRLAAWFLARRAETSNDRAGARAWLGRLGQERDVARLPMLTLEPMAAPRLVRMALSVGLDGLAVAAATTAVDLARRNPTTPSVAAAAAHCRGLVEHDPDALARAAECFGRASLPIAAASALEDLGVELARGPSARSAVDAFDSALRRYAECEASWDASRVRRRLRKLGVRRRLVAPSRPTKGWGGLTGCRTGRRPARGRRTHQPRRRSPAVPLLTHRQHAPTPRLREARHQLPGRADPSRRRPRTRVTCAASFRSRRHHR